MTDDKVDADFEKIVQNLEDSDILNEINRLEGEVSSIQEEISFLDEKLAQEGQHPDIAYRNREDLKQEQRHKERRIAQLRERVVDQDSVLRQVDIVSDAEDIINRLEEIESKWGEEIEDAIRTKSEIKATKNRVANLENTAQSLLEKTTSSALGTEFLERKNDLEEELDTWEKAVKWSIGALILASIGIYLEILFTNDPLGTNISKALLLLPISVAVWFTTSNYNRQKKLVEEYEFKARMALSLSGFREVVREDSQDNDEIVSFVTETMSEIYTNPNKNISEEDNGIGRSGSQQIVKELLQK